MPVRMFASGKALLLQGRATCCLGLLGRQSAEQSEVLLQGQYVNFDRQMKNDATGDFAKARNTDMVEDLGMVEYVFSDKTGTLTSNEMQLRCIALRGAPFGNPDFQ